MKIAILGCGPAGLLAAHACAQSGLDFNIYSVKRKSPIFGAQYIHHPIPGIHHKDSPDGLVLYVKMGEQSGYAKKVYGNGDAPVSWEKFTDSESYPAWSMQRTYDWLWERYQSWIQHVNMSPTFIQEVADVNDLTISAVPRPATCLQGYPHHFSQTTIWVQDGGPETMVVPANTIIYNGHQSIAWYRTCNLFGFQFTEYSFRQSRSSRGMKPTGHNCDCQENLLRVGRFGRWERGILAHDGYTRTLAHLRDLAIEEV